MHWRDFAIWNAAGGISWAVTVGLLAYFLGHGAEKAIKDFGIFGLIGVAVVGLGLLIAHRVHSRRERGAASSSDQPEG